MKATITSNKVILKLNEEEQKDFQKFLNSLDDTAQNIQNLINFQIQEFYNSSVPKLISYNSRMYK